MTHTKMNLLSPKSFVFHDKNIKETKLIIHGQGVFLFNNRDNSSCYFYIYDIDKKNGIYVKFTKKFVKVSQLPNNEPLIDNNNHSGLVNKRGVYYWFSIDSQNQKLQAGIGEARIENVIYQYSFPFINENERKKNKYFLENLRFIDFTNNTIVPLQLLRDPIISKIPLLVKGTNDLHMKDVAESIFLPKSHLSFIGQQLYDCISGEHFILNDIDFPDFSKAIEYSISTPGLWCYEKLKEKSTEFDKDKPNILETYLRITLNQNNGESPGIPYVMEIWPIGHFSPIHNHSAANAIIRVLHGKINVKLFSFLSADEIEPFSEIQFVKDDITWISPTLNQVHQLKNDDDKETCITIQCYMYDEKDREHYDYFDYLDADGNKQQYEPDSDMDFLLFKETMKQEWNLCQK